MRRWLSTRVSMTMRVSMRSLTIGVVFVVCLASNALAQSYPNRPIRMIAPFPAGGLVDVLARAVGEELGKSLGQPVIIENKPGAGGNIGADIVAKAEPDGYTLLMTSPGIQSINEFLYKSMPFDPDKAFAPISLVADMSMLVVVHPKVGAKTLKELIDTARANPGKLNHGASLGVPPHLLGEFVRAKTGIDMPYVPYRSTAAAIPDFLSGQIQATSDSISVIETGNDEVGSSQEIGQHPSRGVVTLDNSRLYVSNFGSNIYLTAPVSASKANSL